MEVNYTDVEIDEQLWLILAMIEGAYDFWQDNLEDIYSEDDGILHNLN